MMQCDTAEWSSDEAGELLPPVIVVTTRVDERRLVEQRARNITRKLSHNDDDF